MIYTKLMFHQKLIVDFAKESRICGAFADYGTGKTLAALSYIDQMQPIVRKILVISSKTAISSTWPSEIEKHSNFRYIILTGTAEQKISSLSLGLRKSYVPSSTYSSAKKEPVIFLINFDGVKNIFEYLDQVKFDMCIVDESTKIKSHSTLRTKVLWALSHKIKIRWIMTGFPITEGLREIYSQIKFLDFGEALGTNYYHFLNKYFYRAGFKWLPKKGTEKKIFKLIKPFTIRITNDVLKLPPQIYQTKMVQPTSQQTELLNTFREYFQIEFGKIKIDTQYIFTLIGKSLQICDGFLQDDKGNVEIIDTAKDETVIDIVEDINPLKNKILIWAVFRFSVRKLKKIFQNLGYKVVTLTGEQKSPEEVDKVIREFQYGKSQIMVATQKKAAESITLTNCRYAVYYSNYWSYDLRANSEARIRRKGSEKHESIIYTDIFLENSIEKLVYDCLRKKKNLVADLKRYFKATR